VAKEFGDPWAGRHPERFNTKPDVATHLRKQCAVIRKLPQGVPAIAVERLGGDNIRQRNEQNRGLETGKTRARAIEGLPVLDGAASYCACRSPNLCAFH
jgi:hypothetical protein